MNQERFQPRQLAPGDGKAFGKGLARWLFHAKPLVGLWLRPCLTALVLPAILAACSAPTVREAQPDAGLAAAFPAVSAKPSTSLKAPGAAPAAGASSAIAAPDITWEQAFTEPRLQALIRLALSNNRDLRIAALNIEAARAQAAARHAELWPSVGLGVAGSRQPTASGGVSSLYSAGLSVTAFEADLFGRLRSVDAAAAAQLLANIEARKAVRIALVAAVAQAAVGLWADEALLRLTLQTLATRESSLSLAELRLKAGAGAKPEVQIAQSLLESVRVTLASLQRQRGQDENALALLLGQAVPPDALVAADNRPALLALQALPAGLPSTVLARRPDVRQAEQALVAARANVDAARAAFFPKITLTGSAGVVSGDLAKLFSGGIAAWSFAPQALLPILDAGRNQANFDAAQAQRDIAVAQYERTLQTAFREVADALVARSTLADQLGAQTALAKAEADRAALTEQRLRLGAASALESLDAQRSVFAAQQALVQVQAAYTQSTIALYRALGGGWSAQP